MASPVPYISLALSITLLHLILTHLHPTSIYRPLMLCLILTTALVTAFTATAASSIPGWNALIGTAYGAQLALESVDHVLLSKLHYFPSATASVDTTNSHTTAGAEAKDSPTRRSGGGAHFGLPLPDSVLWTLDVVFNKRRIGTARQVKNVPHFRRSDPTFIPSKSRFLVFRAARFVVVYLLVDFLTSFSPSPAAQFAVEKVPLLSRLAVGEVAGEEFGERMGATGGFWFFSWLIQGVVYDSFSLVAVELGLSTVEDWPPRFGSWMDAWSVRRFWG
jgi:hypothetical protein